MAAMVPVTWEQRQESPQAGICDFDSRELPAMGLLPLVEFTVVGGTPSEELAMPGQWALCNTCRDLIGINAGDTEASFDAVQLRHRQSIVEICLKRELRLDFTEHIRWFASGEYELPDMDGIEIVPGVKRNRNGHMIFDLERLGKHFCLPLHSKELGQITYNLHRMFRD